MVRYLNPIIYVMLSFLLGIMFPLDGEIYWMFVVDTVILFSGRFFKKIVLCESSGEKQTNVKPLKTSKSSKACGRGEYDPGFNKSGFITAGRPRDVITKGSCEIRAHQTNKYSLILDKETLSRQDVALMSVTDEGLRCMPSEFFKFNSGIADKPLAM